MQNKLKKISFKIHHCSSQDPQYPVTELLHQSPQAKGWQSKRFSSFPQTIVLQLIEPSLIGKLSVLSHQSKIASKIEIEVKMEEADEWKKLGRISLDSNVNTNFQARQLKQANINNVPALFIRLIFRTNHVNNQNIFNQVGIISACFYGQKIDQKSNSQKQISTQLDSGTLNKIKELQNLKKKAVQNEQFDRAKQIKDQIERIKGIGASLLALQAKKQEAIRRQNYEDAKIINEKIKQLRDGGSMNQSRQPEPQRQPIKQQPRPYQPPQDQEQSVSPITNVKQTKPINNRPQVSKKQSYPPKQDDDRPIVVKNQNPYEEPNEQQNVESNQREGELQPLNKELFDDCSQYFGVFDQQIFRYIFSRDHSNREKGIAMISNELKTTKNREDFIGACLFAIKSLIDDKIASVLVATITLFSQMMKKLKPQASSYNQPTVEYILQKMGDFLGHNNQKIKQITDEAFSNFPIYHLTNKDVCYKALDSIPKRDKPPKVTIGRLKAITKIIKEYQLGRDSDEIVRYAVKYLDDKNNDIRNAAINVICAVSAQIGYNSLQGQLKGVRPQIIKSIEQRLDELGAASQPQDFDEKPIKTKGNTASDKVPIKNKLGNQQFESQGNEFIQIPKKTMYNKVNEDFLCQFCGKMDKRFVQEDYKDMHYFNACPMLTVCKECNQAIEISSLTSHLVGECNNSKYYKKCPRCKEAIHQKIYKAHVEKKECLSAKPLAVANRCPLCHLDINPGVNGWKDHLISQVCQNNPRA